MILRLIILFVFVFALLLLNIPQLNESDYPSQKLYIFSGVFIFEFVTITFLSIYHRRVIDIGKIVKESFLSALLAAVGYSVWTDFQVPESSAQSPKIIPVPTLPTSVELNIPQEPHNFYGQHHPYNQSDPNSTQVLSQLNQIPSIAPNLNQTNVRTSDNISIFNNLKLTTLIIMFISVGYLVDSVFKETRSSINDCLNMIYKIDSISP
jgi:hypothetical protein